MVNSDLIMVRGNSRTKMDLRGIFIDVCILLWSRST